MKTLSSFLLFCLALPLFGGEYPDISVKELQAAIKDGKVAVIDVNGAKSFSRGHIPTAIDFSTQGKKLSGLLPKDKNTLVDLVVVHTKEELMLLQNLVTKILNTFQLVSLVGNDLVRKSLKNNNPINIFLKRAFY